jgi:hypothetical protein
MPQWVIGINNQSESHNMLFKTCHIYFFFSLQNKTEQWQVIFLIFKTANNSTDRITHTFDINGRNVLFISTY